MVRKAKADVGGRPINELAGDALLEAARELVAERGYAAVSMQMIAERAGVSRPTAYRRWNSKADLVLQAFLRYSSARLAKVEDIPVQQALEHFLTDLFADINAFQSKAIRSLVASAQEDEAFRESLDRQLVRRRDRLLLGILRRGVANGELQADINLNLLVDMIHGAFWYRLLLGRPLSAHYAAELAAAAVGSRRAVRPSRARHSV